MQKHVCAECKKSLMKDEIALYKKIVDRSAKEYLCLECLSESLGCSVEDLQTKIEEFKEQGCTLFM